MKIIRLFFFIFLNIYLMPETSYSQSDTTIYENENFDKKIHNTIIYKSNNQLSYPIINLNSKDKLTILFDDFNKEIRDYEYTLIHCDRHWKSSGLMKAQYIEGFFTNPIVEYELSFNTIQEYTHYKLIFPEKNCKPKISGNYIIKIFLSNYPDSVILTKRFMILDEKLSLSSNVKQSRSINYRKYKQEVDFIINHSSLPQLNPHSEIQVVVKQNNNEVNSIKNLHPLFIRDNELIYDYDEENTFFGNNEFRYFDINSIRYQSSRIKNINVDSSEINAYLYTDVSRSFDEFITLPDINGNFLINKQESWNPNIEAEYVNVHFSLIENRPISYADIYLIGRFSNWKISEDFKMSYDQENNVYKTSILLKQGYYNYMYALKHKTDNNVELSFIEGSHYETENDYYIYVYYKELGKTYDQLIGYMKTSSKSIF